MAMKNLELKDHKMMKPRRLERRVIYKSSWIDLYLDRVQMPNGHLINEHHLLDLKRQAVACLAENSQGQVVLCKICRYTTGETTWELPAGRMEADETIFQAAERETLEETGCQVSGLELVYSYHPLPGISGQVFHILHGRASQCGEIFDRNEVSQVSWFSREDVRRMLVDRQITDGPTLIGLLFWLYPSLGQQIP